MDTCCSYNPHKTMVSKYLEEIHNVAGLLSQRYENMLLMGDYIVEPTGFSIFDFCQVTE